MSVRIVRRSLAGAADGLPPDLHPVLRRVYAARGIRSADQLALGLERLAPISALEGLLPAVDLLLRHFERRSRIVVVGDFDADGATSTALVVRQLERLGFPAVGFEVPNRFEFGYGLTPELVRVIATSSPGLLVTVDNGISSHAGIEEAARFGIEVLVTDHHLPAATLPPAAAIVNPNLPSARFPSRALAGVGVAFYLMAALTRRMQDAALIRGDAPSVADLLDLVALGTIADLVALDQNNRVLVQQGLRRIRAGRCAPGIRALLEHSGRRLDDIVAADLAFQAGPRLNAAGRLDDMTVGIRCLLTDDEGAARVLAGRLAELNRDRRELEARMQEEALAAVDVMTASGRPLPLGLCLFVESWHQGVVGLVASRLKERLHRPVIALARAADGMLKGSARSVSGVHIRDVLEAVAVRVPGLIAKFGGHAMAAGLTLHAERLPAFQAAFDAEVRRWMTPEQASGVLQSDGEL
ncbi:MAG TPA: single-stranded-DNA-specific exonuclease RecJ, partial [Gammaproteobacteria bacterium]|nr:single-stranded-DNA-specific exonuclease RecJ [Gammaproteobacteria bacterium]